MQIVLLAYIATVNCLYSHAAKSVYTNGGGGAQACLEQQVAQLSQTDRAAGWDNYG